ncbi:MAG: tripartite tricarboxylate transporter TctB family protein [Candidatus Puniceispirillum sp.]|jgi:hypothetical protein|nr:tripartite tricarboxylate transporter TctB family protein [Alphaproteobacteria bacterium]
MGNITKFHLIELGLWATIAVVFFAYSFEFNQTIEIYKFGATGWPRAILAMLVVVMIGNIFYQKAHGSAVQPGRVGIADDDLTETKKPLSAILNIIAFVALPLGYAWSLKPIGFYAATPVFTFLVILLLGERRVRWLIGITFLIYVLLIGLFMVFLNAPLPQGTVSPFYDFSAFMLRMNTQLQHMF